MKRTRSPNTARMWLLVRATRKSLVHLVETPLPCDPREAEVLYVEIEKLLRVLNQLMPSLGDRVQQPAAPLRNH